jgi:hypothetical protein
MFTVKLFDRERLQIIEADSVTVVDETPYLRRLTCARGGSTQAYLVGVLTRTASPADGLVVYDRAIVENGEGRTTEVIRTRSLPPLSERYYPPPPSENPDSAYVGSDPATLEDRVPGASR